LINQEIKHLSLGQRAASELQLPFAATGWRTVWLDHLSIQTANYEATASFTKTSWDGHPHTTKAARTNY